MASGSDTGCSVFGPADNREFFTTWISSNPLFGKLILKNLNYVPFVDDWSQASEDTVSSMAYIAMAGIALCRDDKIDFNSDSVFVLTMAEYLGTCIPYNEYLGQQQARDLLAEGITKLFQHPRLAIITTLTPETYVTSNIPDVACSKYGIFASIDLKLGKNETKYSFEVAMRILYRMNCYAKRTFKINRIMILAHIIASVCEQGNRTVQFGNEIAKAVMDDLNLKINMNTKALNLFYSTYGKKYINDDNIQSLFIYWRTVLPPQAIRLRLSIDNAPKSGLICFRVIGKALMTYPSFQWDRIYFIVPKEFENFNVAIKVVAENPYYRYKQDLGPAKSTNFKTLAYVAKELLIKIGRYQTLTYYGGWPRSVTLQAAIDTLIERFVSQYNPTNDIKMVGVKQGIPIKKIMENVLSHASLFEL